MSDKRILLSAYACEPGLGSEAGIGWNWTRQVSQRYDTWLITREGGDEGRKDLLAEAGVEIFEMPADTEDRPPLPEILALLGEGGVTRLLVEGGSHLAAAIMAEDLVDRIEWFRAPMVMGGDGVPAIQPFGVDRLTDARRYTRTNIRHPGVDLLESLRRGD